MIKKEILAIARETAGYRERYALDHYDLIQKKKENGRKLLKFIYSHTDPYQDANGATFSITERRWVG